MCIKLFDRTRHRVDGWMRRIYAPMPQGLMIIYITVLYLYSPYVMLLQFSIPSRGPKYVFNQKLPKIGDNSYIFDPIKIRMVIITSISTCMMIFYMGLETGNTGIVHKYLTKPSYVVI